MPAQKGSAFLLKISDGAATPTYNTVAGLRTTQMSINGELVVVTSKDSGGWRELLSGAGTRSVSVSAAGIFLGSAAEAQVRGNALAGGCELPLSCDMIVAADNSRFGLPEVKRGIFAGAGGVFRLPRALPRNIALEIVATGDPLPAERLYQLGLINRMVPSAEVMGEAHALAQQIGVNAPLAVRKSLEVARSAYDGTEEELWKASNAASAIVFSSEDAREGPRAFLEKRAPVWKGK